MVHNARLQIGATKNDAERIVTTRKKVIVIRQSLLSIWELSH